MAVDLTNAALLGSGKYGDVFFTYIGGERRAVKSAAKEHRFEGAVVLDQGQQHREDMIKREYMILAKLDHPGVPKVYAYESDNNGNAYVMEFVEGNNLSELIERGVSLTKFLSYVSTVAQVMYYVHDQHVAHNDLHVGNIMVERGTDRVLVLDFGVAAMKALASDYDYDQALKDDDYGLENMIQIYVEHHLEQDIELLPALMQVLEDSLIDTNICPLIHRLTRRVIRRFRLGNKS